MKNSTKLSALLLMALAVGGPVSSRALADSGLRPEQLVRLNEGLVNADWQATAVQGKVTGTRGEALPGVTVVLKGTSTGTTTGVDGSFSLNVPNGTGTLVFSYIGYVAQEVTVDGKSTISVTLQEDTKALDEVVIVGYGEQKKANLTGSVSTVSSEALESRPVQNAGQALQGLIPGLNLQTTGLGGELNQPLNFNIRGTGTIGGNTSSAPLVLIDGMEGDLNAINPQDIESVTVLKDAAASSIYGSRAPFGVILVKTKSGKAGKARVGYSNNFRISEPMGLPEMMDSHTFAMYFNEAATNGGDGAIFSQEVLDRIQQYQRGEIDYGAIPDPGGRRYQYYTGSHANTDWFKEHYKDHSFSQEHNINLNGGTENTQYYVSGGYLDQGGLTRHAGDAFKRYSFTGKINTTISKLAKFDYTARYIREDFTKATHQSDLFYHNVARRWPTVPVKDPNGYWSEQSEIAQLREGGRIINQKDWLYQQAQVTLTPAKGWNIIANGNYRIQHQNNHTDVLPAYAYEVSGQAYTIPVGWNSAGYSSVYEYAYKQNYFSSNIYSDYEFSLNNSHNFKVMAGFNSELTKYRNVGASASGLINPSVPTLTTATDNRRAENGMYEDWTTAGFFGRLNYNFKERYLLEFNGRYDGSSRFIREKRWNFFPSVSAGWNVANEDFWTFDDVIQLFKIRGSYGELGNQQTTNLYPFFLKQPLGFSNGTWLLNGIRPNTAAAPGLVSTSLTWERVTSWNAGFDIALLSNRLNLNFDYFQRKTFDMVGPAPELPRILGTDVPRVNNTDMESRGFEVEVSWQDNIGEFNYGVRAVLADDQQRITKYPNFTGDINDWYAGEKLGNIWGYTTVGIAKTDAEMDAHLERTKQSFGSSWGAGDIMYADLNGDGEINNGSELLDDHGDLSIIGNSTPRYRYSLDLTGDWKGFDFRVFLQGVGKRDYMPNGPYFWGINGGMWQSAGFVEHMDFFRDDTSPMVQAGLAGINLDSYFPAPDFKYGGKNQYAQTRYMQNAAYLRLKNVQLGYSLPTGITSKVGVSRARIYVSGENLLTFSDMIDIFDPESVGLNGWNDGKTYPFARVFSFGLNLNF